MLDSPNHSPEMARRAAWFGFGAALASAAGQTFFIGLSGAAIRGEFGIDDAHFGGLYALATLISGFAMFWLGEFADHMRMRRALWVALGVLISGALLLSQARSEWLLLPALLLLRLGGQGLCGHLAIVAAVRFGGVRTGRGVSIAAFGFIAGEALFPWLVLGVLDVIDWRTLWLGVAGALVLGGTVIGWFGASLPSARETQSGEQEPRVGRARLLRTPSFIASLLIVLVPAFTVTAVFLHQHTLAERMAWSPALLPLAFLIFAATQAAANFAAGWVVDRIGVLPVTRTYLIPLALALLVMTSLSGPASQLIGFALLGVTAGAQGVVGGALWVQLFGARQLGLVRGVYAAAMVLASAVSPWLLGLALTAGLSLGLIAAALAAYALLAPWLMQPVLRRHSAASRRGAAPELDETDATL